MKEKLQYKFLNVTISPKQIKEFIRTICPHLKHREIKIEHIGEYDSDGFRHIDSLFTLQFNENQQITIWKNGLKYYPSGISEETDSQFAAYKILKSWGITQII
ncbi:MAG: hypothetical protein KAT68_19545 [Bacteroidales bacterium]|nr:hypothetical protein [Bacteroidales bacterium]